MATERALFATLLLSLCSVTARAAEATTPEPAPTPTPSPSSQPSGVPVAEPKASSLIVPDEKPEPLRAWGASISANVPHPVFVELEHRFNPRWSAGLGAGGIALNNLNLGAIPVKLGLSGADARVRWHTGGRAFFVGLAIGAQQFSGAATDTIPISYTPQGGSPQTLNIKTQVTANIASAYLTPHLGWFKVFDSGFTLGFEVGIQLPLGPKTEFDLATDQPLLNDAIAILQQTQQYKKLQTDIDDAGNKIGRIPLPYVTVLRLGWMF